MKTEDARDPFVHTLKPGKRYLAVRDLFPESFTVLETVGSSWVHIALDYGAGHRWVLMKPGSPWKEVTELQPHYHAGMVGHRISWATNSYIQGGSGIVVDRSRGSHPNSGFDAYLVRVDGGEARLVDPRWITNIDQE